MIRIALRFQEEPNVQFIVYGKDYADIKKQAHAFLKTWKKTKHTKPNFYYFTFRW